ncbi:hypothetical protein GGR57DRAFT_468759 [Xylariaceae sp. FL1272]|nr:hypothetical protein GGR57DRAFT_468759 [Xylariaceae sp. FL1272]
MRLRFGLSCIMACVLPGGNSKIVVFTKRRSPVSDFRSTNRAKETGHEYDYQCTIGPQDCLAALCLINMSGTPFY